MSVRTGPHLDPTAQRDCRLYRIYGLDPRNGYRTITLVYIGETGRLPFVRFLEHLYGQPCGDTIVGQPEVDPRIFRSKAEVWRAERAAIEAERPLYNVEWNLNNPGRIPPWTAREQRWARDDKAGRARWQPGETTRQAPARTPRRYRIRAWLRRRPARWRRHVLLAGLWLALAVGFAAWFTRTVPARDAGLAGMIAATVVYLAAWSLAPKRRRRSRR